MSEPSDLDVMQDAAIIEEWTATPSYRILQRELEAMKFESGAMAPNNAWYAQVAGLRVGTLDELTNRLQAIIDRKNQIVAAEHEARESAKSSPSHDQVPPRQAPQAT